ncbi:unnamed protein product, partial [Hapterophycus canaliculatus]
MQGTELHHAALRGYTKRTLELLASRQVNVNARAPDGNTPLVLASGYGHDGVVRVLLENGAQVNLVAAEGFTPLLVSAQNGHFQTVKTLLAAGANIKARDSVRCTPLHMAANHGHLAIVKALIKAGAELDPRNSSGSTPLSAAAGSNRLAVVKTLLKAGADPNNRMPSGATALYDASYHGSVEVVKELLRAKAHPAHPMRRDDGSFGVALDTASQNGHPDTVRVLLALGLDVCGGERRGRDALGMASQEQHVDIMSMLTEAGVVDDDGKALEVAANSGCVESVKFLLKQAWVTEAYLNARHHFGSTALTLAIEAASPSMVRLLLDAGADETVKGRDLETMGAGMCFESPLGLATLCLRRKTYQGQRATQEQLRRVEVIRRLLMRVEALRATSWLWQRDT